MFIYDFLMRRNFVNVEIAKVIELWTSKIHKLVQMVMETIV